MTLIRTTRVPRFCLEEGCGLKRSCKGYCAKHYRHYKNTGKVCSVQGCGEAYECRGFCKNHYWRWRTHGDPLAVKTNHGKGKTFEEKFWSRVDKTPGLGRDGDCWEWQGKKLKRGYAHTRFQGKAELVHRISYCLHYGSFPEFLVLHSCDNRSCVNPAHLRQGTLLDNAADMVSRSRQARGERAGNVKLTSAIVKAIREEPQAWGVQTKLAERFGVNTGTISRIRRGMSWKHDV